MNLFCDMWGPHEGLCFYHSRLFFIRSRLWSDSMAESKSVTWNGKVESHVSGMFSED